MKNEENIKLYAFTLDCPDPHKLAEFYAQLLGWQIPFYNDDFACVSAPGKGQGGYPGILFQKNPAYVPPVWPEKPDAQQQMAHMDFAVADLEQAVQHALACGALRSEQQFSETWTVMFDPAGHPFCLCGMGDLFKSPDFALQ